MENTQIIREINITRVEQKERKQLKDHIIDEDILEIFINEEKTFQMVFSKTHIRGLVAGFLYTQGIVQKRKEIESIDLFKENKQCHVQLSSKALNRLTAFKKEQIVKGSSGGILLQGKTERLAKVSDNRFTITARQVKTLIQMHWDHSKVFHKTGAVHSAGLCSPDKILSYYEDIGRHNALDKLAGNIFLNKITTNDKIATVSCRMSLEIIGKIIKTSIPIVISNAAPTLSAVRLADSAGLTIVGFARDNRFNIYTHENRIV